MRKDGEKMSKSRKAGLLLTAFSGVLAALNVNPAQAQQLSLESKVNISALNEAHAFARGLLAREKYTEAIPILRGLKAQNPSDIKLLTDYITASNRAGNAAEVIEDFEKAGGCPVPADVLFSLGQAYFGQADWEKARALFAEAGRMGYFRAQQHEALSLARLGKLSEAEALFTALLAKEPANPQLYHKRGLMYFADKRFEQAAADLSRYLLLAKSAEQNGEVTETLAASFLELGLHQEAAELLAPWLESGKASPGMKASYIAAIGRSGSPERAIAVARAAYPDIAQAPAKMQTAVADAYIRLGKPAEALGIYNTLLGREPGNLTAQAGQAFALISSGKPTEGAGRYGSVLKEAPQLAPVAAADAASLLSQGNYLGGKLLFEKIIALFPDRPEYSQAYAQALALHLPAHAAVNKPAAGTPVNTASRQIAARYEDADERTKIHSQAVELARAGKWDEALALFGVLHRTAPLDKAVLFDYIVVLTWAGNVGSAVELYEKTPAAADGPDYLLRSVGGAYYQTGNYRKAAEIFARLAAQGDRQAKIWLAEADMKMGDFVAAEAAYEELLADAPRDLAVLLSRATMLYEAGQYLAAADAYRKVVPLMPARSPGDKRVEVNGLMAAALIRAGQPNQAIGVLAPFIGEGTAPMSMQADYIVAYRASGGYGAAIQEARRLWPDYGKVPVYGLEALVECYIQKKDHARAVEVYEAILTREPGYKAAQFGRAFSLMVGGKRIQGRAAYGKILDNPENAPLVVRDAETFLAAEDFVIGKSLFELVINKYPDQPLFRQRYAEALARHGLYRSAEKQFAALAAWPQYEQAALAGRGRMAFFQDDRRALRDILDKLAAKYGRSASVAALETIYQEQKRGEAESRYTFYKAGYKQLQSNSWQTSAEQGLGGNYSVLAAAGRTRLDDIGAGQHQTLHSRQLGLRLKDAAADWRVYYGDASAATRFNTFSVGADFTLADQSVFGLAVSREPLLDVQALDPANGGPVMAKTFAMRYYHPVSKREAFDLRVNRSFLTDGNQSTGYSLEHSYTIYDRGDSALTRRIYWGRSYWNRENNVYESPAFRDSVGIAWTWRSSFATGYWDVTPYLNWGKDYPAILKFEPFLRAEYGRDFSPSHTLAVGTEYGARTNGGLGAGGLRHSYRQYDLTYRITW